MYYFIVNLTSRTGESDQDMASVEIGVRSKGRLPIRHMFQNTRDMQPDWQNDM